MFVPAVKLLPSSVSPCRTTLVSAIGVLVCVCGFSHHIQSQTNLNHGLRDSITTHEMPEFRGGWGRLQRMIAEHLEYPKAARKEGVSGRVVVGFMVDTTGTISDIHILESVRPDIDQEALRLVGLLKQWKPGRIDGIPVRVRYELPLTFSLDNKSRRKVKPAISDL